MRAKRSDMPIVRRLAGVLAVLAGLAGVGGGFLESALSGLVCFDTCPSTEQYFSHIVPETLTVMTPCLALVLLTLLAYLGYCIAVRRVRAVALPVLALVGCAAVYSGVVLLGMTQIAAASDLAYEDTLVQWMMWWGFTLVLLSIVWAALVFSLTQEPAKSPSPPVVAG